MRPSRIRLRTFPIEIDVNRADVFFLQSVLRHIVIEGIDDVEVGYAFYPQFWGRGLATEISRACLDFARDRFGLDTVIAVTTPSNLASQNVLRKIGLTYEREVTLEGRVWFLFRTRFQAANPTP